MIIEAHLACNNNILYALPQPATRTRMFVQNMQRKDIANNVIFQLLYSSIIKPARNGFHTDSFQISQQSGWLAETMVMASDLG